MCIYKFVYLLVFTVTFDKNDPMTFQFFAIAFAILSIMFEIAVVEAYAFALYNRSCGIRYVPEWLVVFSLLSGNYQDIFFICLSIYLVNYLSIFYSFFYHFFYLNSRCWSVPVCALQTILRNSICSWMARCFFVAQR